MLSTLLLLVPPFNLQLGQKLPDFVRWSRRYAAHVIGVGAAFHTTARVKAARFLVVGVGDMLHMLLVLVSPFTLRLG